MKNWLKDCFWQKVYKDGGSVDGEKLFSIEIKKTDFLGDCFQALIIVSALWFQIFCAIFMYLLAYSIVTNII